MSEPFKIPEHLAAMEQSLCKIPLPASTVDRDRLLFASGWAARQSAERKAPRWLWPTCSAALAVTAATLAFALIVASGTDRPAPSRGPARVSNAQRTMDPPRPGSGMREGSWLAMRRSFVEGSESPWTPELGGRPEGAPSSQRDLLKRMLLELEPENTNGETL